MKNIQLNQDTSKSDFVQMREQRDRELSATKLLFSSVQVNISAGKLSKVETNETTYLKTPISLKK